MDFSLLQELLNDFPVGLSVVDKEGVQRYANQWLGTQLALPPALLKSGVHVREILEFQVRRGDLGQGDFETLVEWGLDVVLLRIPGAERYRRTLANGCTLEMHRQRLADGSVVCVYQDVSEQQQAESALAAERALLRSTIDLMPLGILVSDEHFQFELVNRQVAELFDVPESLIQEGSSYHKTIRYQAERGDLGPGDPATLVANELARMPRDPGKALEYRRTIVDGHTIDIRRRALAHGRMITIYSDVSERTQAIEALRKAQDDVEQAVAKLARANQELQHQALSDPLTGAWNRRYFMQQAGAELARCQRQPARCCGVLLLDVDHFKRINDRFGHGVGDQVLVALVQTLEEQRRRQDLLFRLGGEEFALLLPDTDIPGIKVLAERFQGCIRQYRLPDGTGLTVSMGLSVLRPSDTSIDAALGRADRALYRAKAAGRDQVMVDFPAAAG